MRNLTEQIFPILRRIQDLPIPKTRRIDRAYAHQSYSWWGGDAEEIHKWHLERNFNEIGYPVIVNFGESLNIPGLSYPIRPDTGYPAGIIQIGRDINKNPAHVLGDNPHTTGACGIGLFDFKDKEGNLGTKPDPAGNRERAMGVLLATYCKKLDLPVGQVLGHREAKFIPGVPDPHKSCPGDLIDCDLMRAFVYEILHNQYNKFCDWYEQIVSEFVEAHPNVKIL